ncbi:MAG: sigma-54-dependent Fis family transcriptional regulator [bacterium]|nr:sigma-54-dependent Fis family transcriptional regulator [bacterium]
MKKILIIDDELSFREVYSEKLRKNGAIETFTAESGEEALVVINKIKPDMVICDVRMSGIDGITLLKKIRRMQIQVPFLIITAYGNIKDAVKSVKLGAVDYLEKPVDLNELKDTVYKILNIKKYPSQDNLPKDLFDDIITENKAMHDILIDAYHVAKSDISILISGESGTGKDVLAKFIHENSLRSSQKVIAVNCASISANIIGSELFGHEKGAFTGASSKRAGRFKEADGGTLFLDEIGDMPMEIQPTLLRALENKTITPVGSDKEVNVDFRLIAATNRPLEEFIKQGKFREDLFYRLNVISFNLPSLRERKEDIMLLARHFLNEKSSSNKKISAAVEELLINYSWPGNIRELSNCMKRARVLSRTEFIMPEHLSPAVRDSMTEDDLDLNLSNDSVISLENSEIEMIKKALKETNGNQTQAAKLLGINRRTLFNKLKKLDN